MSLECGECERAPRGGLSDSQCVDALIERYMAKYPSAHARYFEEVHQALAPLARELERALTALLDEFDRITSNHPSPYEVRKAVSDAARAVLQSNAGAKP